jgi:hypothetical protein
VGAIHVHEFMSLDGVIDTPIWTFDYGFDERMGEAIGAVTARSRGILLGRTTYEMFETGWSTRTVEDDPGAPFFNDTTKYVVSGTLTEPTWRNSEVIGAYDPDAIRTLKERRRRRPLRQRERHAGPRDARDGLVDRAAPVRLPADPRLGTTALHRRCGAPQAGARGIRRRTRTAWSTSAYRPQA